MTRYSAYDADAVTVRVRSQIIDILVFLRLTVLTLKIWLYRERNFRSKSYNLPCGIAEYIQ